MKKYFLLFAILLMVLMIGCSSDVPTIENDVGQTMLAPALTEAQINSLILIEAAKWNNRYGGECKAWVQEKVVWVATSRWLPQNDLSTLYQWLPSQNVRVIWQFKPANYCITSFPTYLKAGQIIQIKWRPTYINNGRHTIILTSVSPTSISYWEANSPPGANVKSSTTSIGQWQKQAEAWTVYQVI